MYGGKTHGKEARISEEVFWVVMIAVFSLTLLSPEVATQLGTMQTVQAAVKISSKSLIMVKGQKKTLKLKGTKKKAKWSSSKKSVATVSSKGVVVGKKKRYNSDYCKGWK